MRVICIDGLKKGQPVIFFKENNNYPITKEEEIYEGEVYTVIAEVEYESQKWYQLAERPVEMCYSVKRFAPISTIDETEFERNYNKETV